MEKKKMSDKTKKMLLILTALFYVYGSIFVLRDIVAAKVLHNYQLINIALTGYFVLGGLYVLTDKALRRL
ncbi:hypothetical protein [Methanomethylovorans sp.]|uniref:hypothetical protein n=1 Tax=Methanomethylovorans sp. TaxID=2758717 RepID=UPI00351C4480